MRTLLVLAVVMVSATAGADDKLVPIWVKSVTASSTFADKRDAYAPWLTVLPRTTTIEKTGETRYDSAWCEGKKDEGIGESITIAFAGPTVIPKVEIKHGVWMTQKLFDDNNLITGLEITTDDGRKLTASPAAKRDAVVVKLGGKAVSSITVKVTSVKKGKMNDSCITEISFGDDPVLVGFDSAAMSAFDAAAKEVRQTLWDPPKGQVACDAKVLGKYFEFPFTFVYLHNTHASKNNIVRSPKKFATAADFEKACKKGFDGVGDVEMVTGEGPGKLKVELMTAEYMQTMHMAWKDGRWRVTLID